MRLNKDNSLPTDKRRRASNAARSATARQLHEEAELSKAYEAEAIAEKQIDDDSFGRTRHTKVLTGDRDRGRATLMTGVVDFEKRMERLRVLAAQDVTPRPKPAAIIELEEILHCREIPEDKRKLFVELTNSILKRENYCARFSDGQIAKKLRVNTGNKRVQFQLTARGERGIYNDFDLVPYDAQRWTDKYPSRARSSRKIAPPGDVERM